MAPGDHEIAEPQPSWVKTTDRSHHQLLEDNWLFRLRKQRFQSRHSGKSHDFYVIDLPDAVHVVALTPEKEIVLVKQFRAGSGRDSLEIPGGILDPGEDPCTAGTRELREETGYAGDAPMLLGTFWANPSLLSSRTSTVLIRNARPVAQPDPDQNEELTIERVPTAAIPRMILDGRVDHALVVGGLLWWLAREEPELLRLTGA